MRWLLIVLAALSVACPASAGTNPDVRIYLDADPPNYVHEVHPDASETFDVYVCLDCLGYGSYEGGVRGVAFKLVRTFYGFKLSQTGLLGGSDFGDAEVDGWTIAAGADCVYPDEDFIIVVGMVRYLYTGYPGTLDLAPHPDTGRGVLDCLYYTDDYCIAANLGVSVPPNPGDPYCYCDLIPVTHVLCEPQGVDNPSHPPTYWYDVSVGSDDALGCGFSVRVFDREIENYTNWVAPDGWTHVDSVRQIGDELWVTWCTPSSQHCLFCGPYRFGFDHPGLPAWGDWTITGSSPCNPFGDIRAQSSEFGFLPDGYGHRVHVPVAGVVPVGESSWGTIKALYR
jgi:hypothetical protein